MTENELKNYLQTNIKIDSNTQCWNWQGKLKGGYGRVRNNKKQMQVHRASYQVVTGAIPDGLIVRHVCNNKQCINPVHLTIGTNKDKIIRHLCENTLCVNPKHLVIGSSKDNAEDK